MNALGMILASFATGFALGAGWATRFWLRRR